MTPLKVRFSSYRDCAASAASQSTASAVAKAAHEVLSELDEDAVVGASSPFSQASLEISTRRSEAKVVTALAKKVARKTTSATFSHRREERDPFIPRRIEFGPLMGIARPGYVAYNKERPEDDVETSPAISERESQEISDTLDFVISKGACHLISLSNQEFHTIRDPFIQRVWTQKRSSGEAPPPFFYIRNEDHFHNRSFRKGDGPTREKLQQFLDYVLPAARRGERIVFYCGAGEGRSYTYITSYILMSGATSIPRALSLIKRYPDSRKPHFCSREEVPKKITRQMHQNFGIDSLMELSGISYDEN